MRSSLTLAALAAAVFGASAMPALGGFVTLRSGDATLGSQVGQEDQQVYVLPGSAFTGYGSTSSTFATYFKTSVAGAPTDFQALQNADTLTSAGSHSSYNVAKALIVAPASHTAGTTTVYDWKQGLTSDANAQWISAPRNTDQADNGTYYTPGLTSQASAVYAIWFYADATTHATIDLHYLADNTLGWRNWTWQPPTLGGSSVTTNEASYGTAQILTAGVYLNGDPLTDTNGVTADTSLNDLGVNAPDLEHVFTNVTLQQGDNWLFLNANSYYDKAGIIFSADVQWPTGDAPEPASLGLLGLGAMALLRHRKR